MPARASEIPAVLIVVSVRARLLTRSAASITPVTIGPEVPASAAARAAALIWATIWSSPTAIESSPHATENRCSTAGAPTRTPAICGSSSTGTPARAATISATARIIGSGGPCVPA